MQPYIKNIENILRRCYDSFSEKAKRHYAAAESIKLGHGGVSYISELFDCSRNTIIEGIHELTENDIVESPRIRRKGGGRPPIEETIIDLKSHFLDVISEHIAGDPMNSKIRWVKLKNSEIRELLKKKGISVGKNAVRKLLKDNGFVKRKMQRKKSTGKYKDRDFQFRKIAKTKKEFMNSKNPVLSMDTKKKEDLGDLHRAGSVYCTQALESYDHDYPNLSEGKLVPHGIYDLKRNEALITIGIQSETAEFICDALKKWWGQQGTKHYPNATEILIFCDAGGANSYRHHIFKIALQNLANAIGMPIRICHYPPYASKWNPIEHQVFPHVTRAMEGVPLKSAKQAKELIKKTKTETGLNVLVNISKKIYKTGIEVTKEMIEKINITHHGKLGKLNYIVSPAVT